MTGKILTVILVVCTVAAGIGMYYLQVYHFYDRLPAQDSVLMTAADGSVTQVAVTGFEGIDADSSPIRYRACFEFAEAPEAGAFEPYTGAVPRNAPYWFDCFDADALGAAIEAGEARVVTGQRNLEFGIDRVVAITEAGRGYVWHEVNDCGDRAYDGTPLGEDCPPRD